MNAIYLPVYNKDKPLYIGFFNIGAYQESIGGYGGLQHCLIPAPKHLLISTSEHASLGDSSPTYFKQSVYLCAKK